MFLTNQTRDKVEHYKEMLKSVASLSRLFSESSAPYLYYRVAENLFCRSFDAENLSRSDVAIDASWQNMGIGLKTFLKTTNTKLEKVAEFNTHSTSIRKLAPEQQVLEICRLRNERLETSLSIYGLEQLVYHCVVRESGNMIFIESPMHTIHTDSVTIVEANDKVIKFKDSFEEYSFNISKSTLFKRFTITDPIDKFAVNILEDPFTLLADLLQKKNELGLVFREIDDKKNYVVLPLYSTRQKTNEGKSVPEKSGLNQWNASGRTRHFDEVYIPVPAQIHQYFPEFFPSRDEQFSLELPNKKTIQAKVCQEGGKALMSNPNADLGQWILRDVLKLADGEILNYEKLQDIGLDSVVVYKLAENKYKIDFAKIGTFERFQSSIQD